MAWKCGGSPDAVYGAAAGVADAGVAASARGWRQVRAPLWRHAGPQGAGAAGLPVGGEAFFSVCLSVFNKHIH